MAVSQTCDLFGMTHSPRQDQNTLPSVENFKLQVYHEIGKKLKIHFRMDKAPSFSFPLHILSN